MAVRPVLRGHRDLPAERQNPIWFMFAVAVAGLHFLARFQCVAEMEPDGSSSRCGCSGIGSTISSEVSCGRDKTNLIGKHPVMYVPRMTILSVEQPDGLVSSTSGIAVDFVRDWRQAASRLNAGHRTAFHVTGSAPGTRRSTMLAADCIDLRCHDRQGHRNGADDQPPQARHPHR